MFDMGSSLVAAQVNNAHGGKATPKDFMPYATYLKESEDVEVSEDEFFNLLAASGKGKVK